MMRLFRWAAAGAVLWMATTLAILGVPGHPASGTAVAVSPPVFTIGVVIPTTTPAATTSPTPTTTASTATTTTATGPAAGTGPGTTLSRTGASVGALFAAGLALLLLGTVSVLAARRRRGAG